MNVDFSVETLPLKLPLPFKHNDKIIDKVVIQRLYAPELSRLKNTLAKGKQTKASTEYLMFAKSLASLSVVDFYSGDTPISDAAQHILINLTPPQNIYKVLNFSVMLIKETSLCTTAYSCSECGKTTLFNLDPSQPVPKNIEEERDFMEDFLTFYSETTNKTGKDYFDYILKSPIKLENPEGKELIISRITLKYPSLQDYLKNSGDSKRDADIELWALYDNIISINELPQEDTLEIKKHNGFEKIMRLKAADLQGLISELNKYGMEINHSYTCKLCGSKHEVPFDYTNFFDFLKSGA